MCLNGVGRTFENNPLMFDSVKKSGAAGQTNFCYIRHLNKWQFGQYQKLICKFLSCLELNSNIVLLKFTNLSSLPHQLRSHAI